MSVSADPRECPYVGLDPFETAHEKFFFGRRQDSKVIADHVVTRAVTVVYGASGVGKSSLLNVGLPDALGRKGSWIIVRLRDWQNPAQLEQAAVVAVCDALAKVPVRGRERLRFGPLVKWAVRSTRRPLLLILDQFEEYFLYRGRELTRSLEAAMGDLLIRRDLSVHVLIALRDDALHRLDQLRAFVPGILDSTIQLGPLSDEGVKEAICGPIERYNEIYRKGVGAIVIEGGLVETLIRQLKEAGSGSQRRGIESGSEAHIELPYLQLALMKLWAAEGGAEATALREATLTDEAKLGGVRRIVRDHVRTVMAALTPDEQALCARIFDRLVTGIGSKIAYPTEALAAEDVAGRDVTAKAVTSVLDKLTPKDARILKPVTTEGGLSGFEIFHDVLGPPVLEWRRAFEADRRRRAEVARADRRTRIVAWIAGACALAMIGAVGTATYIYKQQKALQDEKKKSEQALAAVSKARNAAEEALVDAGRARGLGIWLALDFAPTGLLEGHVDALWQVATATGYLRDGFIAPLSADRPDLAVVKKFIQRPGTISRALGLSWPSPEMAAIWIRGILTTVESLTDQKDLELIAPAVQALAGKLSPNQLPAILAPVRADLVTASGFKLKALCEVVEVLAWKLTPDEAHSTTPAVLRALSNTTDPDEDRLLGRALKALVEKVMPEQAPATLGQILEFFRTTDDVDQRQALIDAIRVLAGKLTNEQAHPAFEAVLKALTGTEDPDHDRSLGQALRVLAGKLTPEQAQTEFQAVLTALSDTEDPDQDRSLGQVLQALAGTLSAEQKGAAFQAVLASLRENRARYQDEALGETLQSLAAKLTFEQAAAELASILTEIAQSSRANQIGALVRGLKALPTRPVPQQVEQTRQSIVKVFSRTTDAEELKVLAEAMQVLPGRLTAKQAESVLQPILKSLTTNTEVEHFKFLAQALQALPALITAKQSDSVLQPILKSFTQAPDPGDLKLLAEAVQAFPGRLGEKQMEVALKPILISLTTATDADEIKTLTEALQALSAKLVSKQALAALDSILRAISQTNDTDKLKVLAEAVQSLAVSEASFESVITAFMSAAGSDRSRVLGESLQALAGRLSPGQARPALEQALRAAGRPATSFKVRELSQVAEALAAKLSAEQVQGALDAVLKDFARLPSNAKMSAHARLIQIFSVHFTTGQMQAVLGPALASLTAATNLDRTILPAARVVQASARSVDADRAQAALQPILTLLGAKIDPDQREELAFVRVALTETLASLAEKMTTEHAQAAVGSIVKEMSGMNSSRSLRALAQVVRMLPVQLDSEQAQGVLGPVLKAIVAENDRTEVMILGQALRALLAKLTDNQSQVALESILKTITNTTNSHQGLALAQALETLAGKLSAEHAERALELARSRLADARLEDEGAAWATAIDILARFGTDEQYIEIITNILKYPTTVGQPTQVLINALHRRFSTVPELNEGLAEAMPWLTSKLGVDTLEQAPARPRISASSQ